MPQQFATRWLVLLLLLAPTTTWAQDRGFPVEIHPTSLLRGPRSHPSAVVELELRRPLGPGESIRLHTPSGTATTITPQRNAAGERFQVPVPLPAASDSVSVIVELQGGASPSRTSRIVRVARPEEGWVLHLIPGFHYDPVWWNTQANYTESGGRMGSDVGAGHTLVAAYLQWIARDRDATVALHQLPYLQTFVEARPWQTRELEASVRSGRCALVGGTFDELSSTLIGPEAIVRNAVYGSLFQREVLGGDGRVAWQCDVFGHDPSFPSLMARTGHTAAAFARGPFHQWGAPRDQVDFPSEFVWMGPDGTGILTHYMTGHYGYAYGPLAAAAAEGSQARADEAIARMFEDLKRPALTYHVMLPMQSDFARPIENLGAIVRAWNAVYLSPQVEISTPERFFAAVQTEVRERKLAVPVITRDMNPIYTGCGVSFADLKQAERDCEAALRDAETLATLAALQGAVYPEHSLDRAWRQLFFAAHHDAVTGSSSDQVYVDLLYVYRDALDLAQGVRERALEFLAATDPEGASVDAGAGERAPTPVTPDRRAAAPLQLANEQLVAVVDLERGGTLTSLRDARTGQEFLRGPGNDVVQLPEYPNLPGHGEGPWHLAPTGARRAGTGVRARVMDATPADPHSIVVEAAYPEFTKRQTYTLRPGSPALEMTTEILDWRGSDALLRVEFPVDAPAARPVFQTAAGVIGRPFARDVATAQDPWTLDQTCWGWVELGSTCKLEVREADRVVHTRALGVGEIVVAAAPAEIERAGELARAFVRSGVTTTITRADRRRTGDLAFDSNVPDFRVAIGDPVDVPVTLGAGGSFREGVAGYVERDAASLPVLVIPDRPALETVIHTLETEHAIRVDRRDARVDSWTALPDRGIALLSRDAVSVHVTEGVLGLNLLRSCTGWPAGVWIDPPARRLPDGAPFETMHGSHRFQYALLPHAGDWRAAHLPERARDLRPLPARASFDIEPAGVLLMAFKPEGFAEARWRTSLEAAPATPHAVVLRLWNATGEAVEARVRVPQLAGEAWRADALETRGRRLRVTRGVVLVPLEPFAYETIVCSVRPRVLPNPSPTQPLARSLEVAPREDASAYWLENRGEGVTWNGIVTLAPEQHRVELVNGVGGVRIAVANNHRSKRVTLRLEIDPDPDPGLRPRLDRETVDVAPGEHVPVLLLVEGPPGAHGVRAPITVRARLAGGVDASWTTVVWFEAPDASSEPPFEVVCDRPIVGASGALQATLVNRTDVPVTGEATWLAPRILWDALPAWRRPVTVPARGAVVVSGAVHGALDSWTLLRFTAAGRVAYGEPTAIVGDPARVLVRTDVDRVRVREGMTARLRVVARSLAGLTSSSRLAIEATRGWAVRELDRSYEQDAAGRRLESTLEVRATGGSTEGSLSITPARGAAAQVSALLVPVQHAAPQQALVRVDGDLSEWRDAEFTRAESPLGRMRAAVRWGRDGLAVAMAVQDSAFVQTHTGAGLWEGDSVQLGFTVVPADVIGYDAQVLEVGAARTPDGPTVWCWYGGAGGRTGRIPEAPLAVRTDSGWTRYEMLLPRSMLPGLRLEPGSVLGFSYIANDDDGAGFRGAVQWTRGMSGGKDASLFGDLVLDEE